MANLSSNLLAAWDNGDGSEPDPTKLPDLLRLAEARLEESVESFRTLLPHFEQVQQRSLEARNNLQGMLGKSDGIPPELAEVAEENLQAFDDLIVLMEDISSLEPDDDLETHWEALGAFEETSENLRASSLKLSEVASSMQ